MLRLSLRKWGLARSVDQGPGRGRVKVEVAAGP